MSERSRSSGGAGSGLVDRPPGKVTIARTIQYPPMPPMVVGPGAGFHSLEAIASLHHISQPRTLSYGGPPSVAGKSDNATVNSGSMIEDIDMASIMSGDGSIVIGGGEKGQRRCTIPPPPLPVAPASAAAPSSHQGMLPHHPILTKKGGDHPHNKHDRGVEFAAWAQSYPAPHPWLEGQQAPSITSQPSRSPPPPGTIVAVPTSGALLNDMGPPLNRSILLERIAGATGLAHPSAPSTHSRAGSVASGSVGRPSDVSAHVDTDDCGGSLMGSTSDHMHDRMKKSPGHGASTGHSTGGELSDDNAKIPSVPSKPPSKGSNNQGGKDDGAGDADTASLSSARTALAGNGRQSPGGTVYRGRGVRRYQGQYMNLPLKRFQSKAACAEGGLVDIAVGDANMNDASVGRQGGVNEDDRSAYWHRERLRSRSRSNERCSRGRDRHCHSRSRSRSRSRDREEDGRTSRSWSRGRASSSRSPSSRWSNDGRSSGGCRRRSRRNRGRR